MFDNNVYVQSLINNPAEFDEMPANTKGYYNFDVKLPVLETKQNEEIELFILTTVRKYGGLYYAHEYDLMNNPTLEIWGFLIPSNENIEEIEKIILNVYPSSKFRNCEVR